MAKKSKYIALNEAQKEEIRRLTQLANRRIVTATNAYRKAGKDTVPKEMVGPYQIKEDWHTPTMPMSRSTKFETAAAHRAHVKFLQSFDEKAKGETRPGIREYTRVQREKTIMAVESSLGVEPPAKLQKKLRKMTAVQLSDFWNAYSTKTAKMGEKYASDAAMAQTLAEYFPEDMANFNALTREFVTPPRKTRKKKKKGR
jgi:hypothetical protein